MQKIFDSCFYENIKIKETEMRIIKGLINVIFFVVIFFAGSANAYNNDSVSVRCKLPKFRSFSPPEKTKDTPIPEVEPESEIGFTVSGHVDPASIKVVAKGRKLELKIEDKMSYFQVSAKLPAELKGEFARINIRAEAKAKEGFCIGKDGWLIKIKDAVVSDDNTETVTTGE
jgi:biopolymer transport protein ExbD